MSKELQIPEFASQVPKMQKETIWVNIWSYKHDFRIKWPLKKVSNKSLSVTLAHNEINT